MISWEFSGKENFIMIGLCQWDVRHHVALMPHLIHILDDYLMAAPTFHQCRINLDRVVLTLIVSYLFALT